MTAHLVRSLGGCVALGKSRHLSDPSLLWHEEPAPSLRGTSNENLLSKTPLTLSWESWAPSPL